VSGEKRSLLGELVPGLETTPLVAELTMALATADGDALVCVSRYSAAVPVTCGVAIDVPLMVLVAVVLVYHAEVMLEPGAKRSRQLPKFE